MTPEPERSIDERIAALQAEIAELELAKKAEGAQEATKQYLEWLSAPSNELTADTLVTMLSPAPSGVVNLALLKLNTRDRETKAGSSGSSRAPRLSLEEVEASLPSDDFKLSDLAAAIDREEATARNLLAKLIEAGKVGEIGDDPSHSGRGRAPKIYRKV